MKPCKKHPNGERYKSGPCKQCSAERVAATLTEEWIRYKREWRRSNPVKNRDYCATKRYKSYGVNVDEAKRLMAAHGPACDC